MDPISIPGGIIAVLKLGDIVLRYLNDVKNAPKEIGKCAIEISNIQDLLTGLKDRIEGGSADLRWYNAARSMDEEGGIFDQCKMALKELEEEVKIEGRLKKLIQRLKWTFTKADIATILAEIERLKISVSLKLELDHFELSQAVHNNTEHLQQSVRAIGSGVDNINDEQAETRHRELVKWISPSTYPAQHSDIMRRIQEGTGRWFLDAPEFKRWLEEPKSTLFCPGGPGAGKTMMATIVIDHLLESVENSSVGVAYVYCNYKDKENQDTFSMLAAILKQLVQAQPSLAEQVEELHKRHVSRDTKPSEREIFHALQEIVAKYTTVFVVIDALDEYGTDGNLRLFLEKLEDLRTGHDFRLMATSRLILYATNEIKKAVTLEIRAREEDVRQFVACQMNRLPLSIRSDPSLHQLVENEISVNVDGMFLLARLHIDVLSDKTTALEVKTALNNLKKGSVKLDDIYDKSLKRIRSKSLGRYELAKKVLSWVTYARRPLTVAELCCALAVERHDKALNTGNIPHIEDVLSVCAGLVIVDQESGVVRLVHQTVQEYLEGVGNKWIADAELRITNTCLTYLSFDTFRKGITGEKRIAKEECKKRLRDNKFLHYAATYWGFHAATVEEVMSDDIRFFLSDALSVSYATQVFYNGTFLRLPSLHPTLRVEREDLCLAARFGLSNTLAHMLSTEEQGHESGNWFDQTLAAAVEGGNRTTIQFLLDKLADIDTSDTAFALALRVAAQLGRETIVELLIQRGANDKANYGRRTFFTKPKYRHQQTCAVMLPDTILM